MTAVTLADRRTPEGVPMRCAFCQHWLFIHQLPEDDDGKRVCAKTQKNGIELRFYGTHGCALWEHLTGL